MEYLCTCARADRASASQEHLTDEGESLSSRLAGFIQRGVERLGSPGVHLIKKLPSGDIKVWADPAAAQRLLAAVVMSVPSVASGGQTDLAIKFDKPKPRSAQGLIYAPFAAEEDVDELAQLLETQGVTAVRRLPSRGRHADGKLFVLTFSDSLVPDNILLLYHRLAVKPFVQYPIRCKRCQGYRHSARYCRRPVRCGTCAGAHLTDSCEAQAPRCAACDGDHPVTDSVCPEWRAQFLINKAMALDNISFQEAVRRFKLAPAPAQVATTRPPQQPSRFSQQPPTPPVWQQACPPPAPQQPRPPPAPQQQCPPPAPQQPRPPTAPQQSGAPRSPGRQLPRRLRIWNVPLRPRGSDRTRFRIRFLGHGRPLRAADWNWTELSRSILTRTRLGTASVAPILHRVAIQCGERASVGVGTLPSHCPIAGMYFLSATPTLLPRLRRASHVAIPPRLAPRLRSLIFPLVTALLRLTPSLLSSRMRAHKQSS